MSSFLNSTRFGIAQQQVYSALRTDSAVTYTLVIPAGPTTISMVGISSRGAHFSLGGGQFDFAGAGALAYRNAVAIPGDRTFYVRLEGGAFFVSTGLPPENPGRTGVINGNPGSDASGGGSNGGGSGGIFGGSGATYAGGTGNSQATDPGYSAPDTASYTAAGLDSGSGSSGLSASLLGPGGGTLLMGNTQLAGVRIMWNTANDRAYPSTNVADQFA